MKTSGEGFIETFVTAANDNPDLPALEIIDKPVAGQVRWTYGELLALMEQYRWTFLSQGIQAGDAVLLHLPSGTDFIACVYALASLSAVFAPVNPHLTPHELDVLVKDLQPVGIVTSMEHADLFAKAGARFVLLAGEKTKHAAERSAASSPLTPPEGNPVVSCHYTYKGVGYPLGAGHRYHDYTQCVNAMKSAFPQPAGAVHLVALPIQAIYGLTAEVFGPLMNRAMMLVTNKVFDLDILGVLEGRQVGLICVVPFLLRSITSKARKRLEQSDPFRPHPNLQIVCGGSYLDPELAEEAKAVLGLDIYQGYGLTETLPVAGTFPGKHKHGSLGVPFSRAFEVAIFGPDGSETAPGVAGHIGVRTPTLMTEFRGRRTDTDKFLREGWFMTGDLGYKDEEGFLYFVGRSYALTKIAAQMVDLAEVETALASHPAVAEARVTVRKRPQTVESLTASVILHEEGAVTERDLRMSCRKLLSSYKVPREIRFCQRV